MKAKVLISFYRQEFGHKAYRVYLEPDFEQAEKDLDLIQNATNGDFELQECEVYKDKETKFSKDFEISEKDIATIEQLHDELLDFHGYSFYKKILKNARELTDKMYKVLQD